MAVYPALLYASTGSSNTESVHHFGKVARASACASTRASAHASKCECASLIASAQAIALAHNCKILCQPDLLTNYPYQILNDNINVGRNENVNIISKTQNERVTGLSVTILPS